MKRKLSALSQHDAMALKKHLKHGSRTARTGLQSALRLGGRTAKLAAANRSLRKGISRHKTREVDLRKSDEQSKQLLKKSYHLQRHLRHLTHQLLSAQEDKRKKLRGGLQDEIAQTLLGINVRLLTLKRERANAEGFKKDIACTQRLVEESIRLINQFTRELDMDELVSSPTLEGCDAKPPTALSAADHSHEDQI